MTYNQETKTFTIETAEEAAIFDLIDVQIMKDRNVSTMITGDWEFSAVISKEEVLVAITPSEGDAVFDLDRRLNSDNPRYYYKIDWWPWDEEIKANALTIGKTVGQLRELLAQARGEA